MTLTTGARLVRAQPALTIYHGLHRGTPPASALPLRSSLNARRKHTNSHIASIRPTYPHHASQIHHRHASTTPPKPPPSPDSPLSDPLNPPFTTRPPPLSLPTRDVATTSLFRHLLNLGKAYTTFYKAGLSAVFTNRRLLLSLPRTHTHTHTPTRSHILLRARVHHDISRLPLFGLLMLICGELTPLIVLLFPRLTPYTCRIPSQTAVIRARVESRRAASQRALSYVLPSQTELELQLKSQSRGIQLPQLDPRFRVVSGSKAELEALVTRLNFASTATGVINRHAPGHICRSLGLGSPLWDKLGFDVPFAGLRANTAVQGIVRDDNLLRAGGGVPKLVDEEVVLACEDRGIDTKDKAVGALRKELKEWLVKSTPTGSKEGEEMEAAERVRVLFLGLEWPKGMDL